MSDKLDSINRDNLINPETLDSILYYHRFSNINEIFKDQPMLKQLFIGFGPSIFLNIIARNTKMKLNYFEKDMDGFAYTESKVTSWDFKSELDVTCDNLIFESTFNFLYHHKHSHVDFEESKFGNNKKLMYFENDKESSYFRYAVPSAFLNNINSLNYEVEFSRDKDYSKVFAWNIRPDNAVKLGLDGWEYLMELVNKVKFVHSKNFEYS